MCYRAKLLPISPLNLGTAEGKSSDFLGTYSVTHYWFEKT